MRQCSQTFDGIVRHVETQSKKKPNVEIMFGGINPPNATPTQRWNTANDIIFTLRNPNFCDDSPRIVKVIGLPESYTELANWFHVINGSNVLVIQSPFGYIKPGSKRWITAKTSKFFKKVKAEGFLIEHPTEAKNTDDAISWIETLVNESGKKIKRAVAKEIIAKEGKNLDTLTNTVGKLCSYQKGKEIIIEDVHACCSNDFLPETVWQFLEDLDNRNAERALAYMQSFYAEGDGEAGEWFYGRIMHLFGALTQHFQFLMVLKDVCGNRDLNAQLVEDTLKNFKKTTPTKIRELQKKEITYDELEPRFSKQYINFNIKKDSTRSAFRAKKSEIYRMLAALHDCIYICRKNSGNDSYLRLSLDAFVLTVCGKITSQQAGQIHGGEV